MSFRDELGISIAVNINLTAEGFGQTAQVTHTFGVNYMPSIEDVNQAITEAINEANATVGRTDLRLTTPEDFGFSIAGLNTWPTTPKGPTQ